MNRSPELCREIKKPSSAEIAETLESHFQRTQLEPEVSYEINKGAPMDECGNRNEGVYQNLTALIKAGDEYFSLIDTLVINQSGLTRKSNPSFKETVIARHKHGQRAEIVGILDADNEPITIGRSHQKEMGLNPKVSREHFVISLSGRGKLEIADLDSSNGTEVFTNQKEVIDSIDPSLGGIDFWSVKSSEMRSVVEERYVRKI